MVEGIRAAGQRGGGSVVGDLVLLPSNEVVVTGGASDIVDFGDGAFDFGPNGLWLARFASDGALAWSRKFQEAAGAALTRDAAGALFVGVVLHGPADLGTGPLYVNTGPAYRRGGVARFEADGGGATWVRAMGESAPSRTIGFRGAASFKAADVRFSTACNGLVDFGGGAAVNCGTSRDIGVRYSTDGGFISASDQVFGGVAIGADGRVLTVGALRTAGVPTALEVKQELE